MVAKRQGTGLTLTLFSAVSLALVMGVLWFLGNAETVHACSCVQPGTPTEELEKFSAVFAGRVVSVQHSFDPDAGSVVRENDERTTVGFDVNVVWKGTVHGDMYITTPPTGGSCGFTFVEGEEYIVYAGDSWYDDGGYTVGICSRTALLDLAQADLDAFGEGECSSSWDGRTSARTTTGHGTGCGASKYRRFQAAILDGSHGRWNRSSLCGWGSGPIDPRPTPQPTGNEFGFLKLTRLGLWSLSS